MDPSTLQCSFFQYVLLVFEEGGWTFRFVQGSCSIIRCISANDAFFIPIVVTKGDEIDAENFYQGECKVVPSLSSGAL